MAWMCARFPFSEIKRPILPPRVTCCKLAIYGVARLFAIVFYALFFFAHARAQETVSSDSISILFRQGYSTLDLGYRANGQRLEEFARRFEALRADTTAAVEQVVITGFASPEGTWQLNQRLSRNRALRIADWLKARTGVADSLIVMQAKGIDWEGLAAAIDTTAEVPSREEVLRIIRTAPETVKRPGESRPYEVRKLRLSYLDDGKPWRYIYDNIFPTLRNSSAHLTLRFTRTVAPKELEPMDATAKAAVVPEPEPIEEPEILGDSIVEEEPEPEPKKAGWPIAIHTNLLYDAIAIPNLGVEVKLMRRLSLAANWHYAWWESEARQRSWRTYGGYAALRYWFGSQTDDSEPDDGAVGHGTLFRGHHLGFYGQILLYDFEWNGYGYMSGIPKGYLNDKPTFGGGIEYGYTMPLAKRLSLDFTLGLGYLGGQYQEYRQEGDKYFWQATKQRNWFGPTKLEINLVWLLGRGNINKKGGNE